VAPHDRQLASSFPGKGLHNPAGIQVNCGIWYQPPRGASIEYPSDRKSNRWAFARRPFRRAQEMPMRAVSDGYGCCQPWQLKTLPFRREPFGDRIAWRLATWFVTWSAREELTPASAPNRFAGTGGPGQGRLVRAALRSSVGTPPSSNTAGNRGT